VLAAMPSVAFADDGGEFGKALQQGVWKAALVSFGAGFLTSLTPCVYPMIAITVSVFGAKQAKSRGQAMALSSAFVAGMVVLFTTMFVVVSLTGGVFGTVLQNRWVIVGIATVFVVMAASMFGAFELTLPDSVMQRLSSVGGVGYGGAFTLGLVSGLVAAPCSGPVLISMMAAVTQAQSVGLGVTFGLSYALGLGVLFWMVGTFAAALPKGGRWMVWVKSFFGIVMLTLALYYLKNAFPVLAEHAKHTSMVLAIAVIIALVGLGLGAVHVNWDDGGVPTKVRKGLGIAATVAGAFWFFAALDKPAEVSAEELQKVAAEVGKDSTEPVRILEFIKNDEGKAIEQAKAENRPLLIDFGAEWCGACKELEKHTFADPEVKVKAGRFVAVRIDATDGDDPRVAALMEKYKVKGLPQVIVLDSEGNEAKRISQFVEAKEFLAMIEPVK
ncbi:MAG TPA: cytochrome c biogenesis protein CcdA, partial [Polyangiaceae bacterium]|nr:cytochrome c biogenesis protein CcdA [Polyangiaceae bacterium]